MRPPVSWSTGAELQEEKDLRERAKEDGKEVEGVYLNMVISHM